MTEIVTLDVGGQAREQAAVALRAGKLVVVPTDTVYAVVADAFRRDAMDRLAHAKGHQQPVSPAVLIRSPRQVGGLVEEVSEPAERLMASYWPGPLTLIFRAAPELAWELGDDSGTLALRMPADDLCLALVGEIGPLAATAANLAGDPPPRSVEEATAAMQAAVALAVDDGPRAAMASTIVDVSGPAAQVLREGAISKADVGAVATGKVGWGQRPTVG